MKSTPQLTEGEEVLHQHVPNLGAFKRTALLLLAVSLVPTIVFFILFPDTFWVAVPLFVSCLLLVQERFNLGKYAAWITNKRVVLQGDEEVALGDLSSVTTSFNAVRLVHGSDGQNAKLNYPKDRAALKQLIEAARQGPA